MLIDQTELNDPIDHDRRYREELASPEEDLIYAVLEMAIRDLKRVPKAKKSKNKSAFGLADKVDAYDFFIDGRYIVLCKVLNIDHERLLEKLESQYLGMPLIEARKDWANLLRVTQKLDVKKSFAILEAG